MGEGLHEDTGKYKSYFSVERSMESLVPVILRSPTLPSVIKEKEPGRVFIFIPQKKETKNDVLSFDERKKMTIRTLPLPTHLSKSRT